MRKNQNQNPEKTQNETVPFCSTYELKNVRWADDNSMCFFNLLLHTANGDLTLYGMRLLYSKADNKPFLSPASRKGTDGKYYGHYYLKMTDEMVNAIVNDLEEM